MRRLIADAIRADMPQRTALQPLPTPQPRRIAPRRRQAAAASLLPFFSTDARQYSTLQAASHAPPRLQIL